jgi:hypothetical protein
MDYSERLRQRRTEGKRQLGRSRHRDIIRMDFTETGWEVMDCMHLAEDRDQLRALINTVMNLQVS